MSMFQFRLTATFVIASTVLLGTRTAVYAQTTSAATTTTQQPPAPPAELARPASVSLSPAVIMVRLNPGQTVTQTLTFTNDTSMTFNFELAAQDVVVKDGKRIFVPAGETPRSIAATAVFSRKLLSVPPMSSVSVEVTMTPPPETTLRAAVAFFRGTDKLNTSQGSVGMTASLGCLFTFTSSNNFALTSEAMKIIPATETQPLTISQPLTNTGAEPVVAEGVVALLSSSGALVARIPVEARRLLPGEKLSFDAEYPSRLKPGKYSAITSFQFEGKTLSNTSEFAVP